MILDIHQITSIIKDNPMKGIVAKGRAYNERMRVHLYGIGLDKYDHMTKVEGFEPEELHNLRAKYSKSNKDLFARLKRPIDKVYSAKGGSVYYNLASDRIARALASDVRNGKSIRKWIEEVWTPHMLDDPFGMCFLEILPTQEALRAKQRGKSFVYPTYKSITSVYDYLPKGSGLEYVVFNVGAQEKSQLGISQDWQVYRVVDDAFDYVVKRDGENVVILQDHTIPNYFTEVPAILNSDISSPEEDMCVLSFFDEAMELATHFLLKGSIKITHEFMHGFPKFWQYADDCGVCNGEGLVGGQNCTACAGSGKHINQRVSDVKLLRYPSKDEPTITPDVAGYISPDKTYYEISTADLELLEELMHITIWGSSSKVKTQGMKVGQDGAPVTATEIMDDMKPQADRLNVISEMAEKRHKFILDAVVRLQVAVGYGGSSVNYGRRYMLEGPDALKEKYGEALGKSFSHTILDNLYTQFLEAEYAQDQVKLEIEKKKLLVKPWFHGVPKEAAITKTDQLAHTYFEDWVKVNTNDAMWLSMTAEALRGLLYGYVEAKAAQVEKDADADMAREVALKKPIAA